MNRQIALIPTPQDLYKIAHHIPELERNQVEQSTEEKEHLEELISVFFRAALDDSEGVITEEMLMVADNLYGPGMSNIIASSLGVGTGELRKLLSKKITKSCRQCHKPFTVVEQRVVNGYSDNGGTLCPACSKLECEKNEKTKRSEADYRTRMLEFDNQLLLNNEDDLFENPDFIEMIEKFARNWIVGANNNFIDGVPYRGGCMLCGTKPVRVFVRDLNILTSTIKSIWDYWENRRKEVQQEPYIPFPPLQKNSQFLSRFSPTGYFDSMLYYPILKFPLIILCENCGKNNAYNFIDILGVDFNSR